MIVWWVAAGAEETRAKLLGYGKALLHFTCSNAIALVLLPVAAWTTVRTGHACMLCYAYAATCLTPQRWMYD